MVRPRKGAEFVCEVCGTTLLVTDEGVGTLEDVVCCEKPMASRRAKSRKKPRRK